MSLRNPAARRRRTTPRRSALSALLAAALAIFAAGCSDTTAPAGDTGNLLDPGAGSIALKDLSVPGPDGRPLRLRLEGSDLTTDSRTGTVSLTVRVRNLAEQAVDPPLIVWIGDLQPAGIAPVNADMTRPPADTDPAVADTVPTMFGFDYSPSLGGAALEPGAVTGPKTWTFTDPALGPFSFAAHAEGAFAPGAARLGGRCFTDLNRNGRLDRGEPPFTAGGVQVTGPDGAVSWSGCDPDGRWVTRVTMPGLYEVLFQSFAMTPLPVVLTTPNPLSVVLPAVPDGEPQSWLAADFGILSGMPPPPTDGVIGFTDRRPAALQVAPWHFLGAETSGTRLTLRVGFSGCQPEHRFSLWMSGGFQESAPPRANLTLVHGTQEACDAAFTDSLTFDLMPLAARYVEQYGPGPLVLVLHAADGATHEIDFIVARPDSLAAPRGS